LPKIDLSKIVGKLPAQIPNVQVPLIVKAATKTKIHQAKNGEFVRTGDERIEWIQVLFDSPVFQSSSSPLKILYRAGLIWINPSSRHENGMTGKYYPADTTKTFTESAIHTLAFKMDGPTRIFLT
jgi:hypothetical protein